MIPIASLTDADQGRWVIYHAMPGHLERGRIKSWTNQFIYVVFHCPDDQWDKRYCQKLCIKDRRILAKLIG